ncbi:MAG: HNH endonuclease [Bdellovibrionales bacterium]
MKNIRDDELLSLIRSKVQTERNLTLEIIELLQEIRDRRLHLQRGYSSLHEFCVKELKYSDGAAYRRIKAMKLVEEMPEAIKSIESGSLSLTTASQLQNVFESKMKMQTPFTRVEKVELFQQVQNQSRQEVERTISKVCPDVVKTFEKVRPINDSQVKVELILDGKLYAKLEKLKKLTSHKNGNLVELIEHLADQELKKCDPGMKVLKQRTRLVKSGNSVSTLKVDTSENTASPEKLNAESHLPARPKRNARTRYIPSVVKQTVWMRDQGRCAFIDPLTKHRCDSNHRIQFEHIKPFAVGGENTIQNLKLLCANHNTLSAVKFYGRSRMEKYQKRMN